MAGKKRRRRQREQQSPLSPQDKRVSIEQFVAGCKDKDELSEDDAYELAWEMHPELNRMRLEDRLPEELVDSEGNIWNPRMHVEMHTIIERQLANNEPDGIREVAIQFEQEGQLDSHEIRHVLAAAVAEQIRYMKKERCPFSVERYFHDIQRLYTEFVEAQS